MSSNSTTKTIINPLNSSSSTASETQLSPLNSPTPNSNSNPNSPSNQHQKHEHHINIQSTKSSTHSNHLPINQNQSNNPSRAKVISTVSFYLIAALVMVMVNKWVLNSIPAPLFFLFCQLVIAVILLKVFAWFGIFNLPTLHLSIFKSLMPLISINVLGLTFNTYCLQFVDASFYQVARGLILPFTVLASYIFLGTRSSPKIHLSILIVTLGFIIGVSSERLTVSHLGVALGIFSSLTTSMHAIIMKRALSKVSGTIDLTYLTNLYSAVLIFPFILVMGEFQIVLSLLVGANEASKTFWVGTVVTGLFGFLIGVAGVLSIKVTSPVTHMISSAVRGVFQTVLSASVFGDVITPGRLGGIAMILIGSIYYTWVKDQELNSSPSSQPTSSSNSKSNERIRMKDFEIQPLVNDDENDEDLNEMDEDDRELIEAAKQLGIDK